MSPLLSCPGAHVCVCTSCHLHRVSSLCWLSRGWAFLLLITSCCGQPSAGGREGRGRTEPAASLLSPGWKALQGCSVMGSQSTVVPEPQCLLQEAVAKGHTCRVVGFWSLSLHKSRESTCRECSLGC